MVVRARRNSTVLKFNHSTTRPYLNGFSPTARTITTSAASSSASFQAGPSSNCTAGSSASKHTRDRAKPDAATLLLLDSVDSIPQYGFTQSAYLLPSACSPLNVEETLKRQRILSTLFPGSPTTFDAKLFMAWNKVCDLAIVHHISTEQVIQVLRAGEPLDCNTMQGKPVRMDANLSAQAEKVAFHKLAILIQERLRLSWMVKAHLTQGITALSTISPIKTTLGSILPHKTILPNFPTPLPLLDLTSSFVATLLTHPIVQDKSGWMDPDGSEWYAVRMRLILAYTTATLHAASANVTHFQDTQNLFWRVIRARENGIAATLGTMMGSGKAWIKWGGRGWLGVFRSLGL
nr:conserved hypothetical protein [Melanopsichium pennsylvanicum 4]